MSKDILEKSNATQNASSKNTIQTINPATGKPLSSYKMMTDQEASDAVKATHEAFLMWKTFPLEKRADYIKKIGESLTKHKDSLVKLMTEEMGKLISQGEQEVDLCAGIVFII